LSFRTFIKYLTKTSYLNTAWLTKNTHLEKVRWKHFTKIPDNGSAQLLIPDRWSRPPNDPGYRVSLPRICSTCPETIKRTDDFSAG